MAYTIPTKQGNPVWPLPADYINLSAEGQREARLALLTSWFDRKQPDKLVSSPLHFRLAFRFFIDTYIKPAECNTTPRNVFSMPDCRWVTHWMRVLSHPLAAVAAFRSSSKTVHFVHLLAPFVALTRAGSRITVSEYNAKRTAEEIEPIMAQLEENELIAEEFGEQKPPKYGRKKWNSEELHLNCGSKIRGVSIGSALRGRHPDLHIQDDIEKDEEAQNADWREYFLDWFDRVVMGMMRPGMHVVWPGTFTHPASALLTAVKRLLPQFANWRTMECPLIVREAHCNLCGRRQLFDVDAEVMAHCTRCNAAITYAGESRHFGPGAISMWPELYNVSDAELMLEGKGTADGRVKGMTAPGFWMEMMCKPHLGGDVLFKRTDATHGYRIVETKDGRQVEVLSTGRKERYEDWIGALRVTMGVDVAYSESKQADYSAGVVLGFDPFGLAFVLDAWRDRIRQAMLIEVVKEIVRRWKVSVVGWECQSQSVDLALRARKELRDIVPVLPLKHQGGDQSKPWRIARMELPMQNRQILFPVFKHLDGIAPMTHRNQRSINALIQEVDRYTRKGKGTAHDDLADALEMAYFVNNGYRPGVPVRLTENEQVMEEFRQVGMPVNRLTIPREAWTQEMWLEARGLKVAAPPRGNRRRRIWN